MNTKDVRFEFTDGSVANGDELKLESGSEIIDAIVAAATTLGRPVTGAELDQLLGGLTSEADQQ